MALDPDRTKPELDFPGDAPPTELVVEDLIDGTGDEATPGRTVERPLRRLGVLDRRGVRRLVEPRRAAATSRSAPAGSSRAGTRASPA